MKIDWKGYVGKRVLVRQGWVRFARDFSPTEVEALEVSSSREYVKFKYPNTWVKVDGVEFVECLDEYPNTWVKVDGVEFVECLDEVEAVRDE